jgi:site-specific recombinase XerD
VGSLNTNVRVSTKPGQLQYLTYLKEARGFSEDSLEQVAKALHRYETYTKFRDFRTFHVEQVRAFKQHLRDQRSQRTGGSLSHATIYSTLGSLKAFFMWVAGQRGFKSRFSFGDWDYFSPSGITASVAKAHRGSRAPTLDQIRRVLSTVPLDTEIHIRDRALIAFVILTGARDRAVASFRLRHLDLARGSCKTAGLLRLNSERPLPHGFSQWGTILSRSLRNGPVF